MYFLYIIFYTLSILYFLKLFLLPILPVSLSMYMFSDCILYSNVFKKAVTKRTLSNSGQSRSRLSSCSTQTSWQTQCDFSLSHTSSKKSHTVGSVSVSWRKGRLRKWNRGRWKCLERWVKEQIQTEIFSSSAHRYLLYSHHEEQVSSLVQLCEVINSEQGQMWQLKSTFIFSTCRSAFDSSIWWLFDLFESTAAARWDITCYIICMYNTRPIPPMPPSHAQMACVYVYSPT